MLKPLLSPRVRTTGMTYPCTPVRGLYRAAGCYNGSIKPRANRERLWRRIDCHLGAIGHVLAGRTTGTM